MLQDRPPELILVNDADELAQTAARLLMAAFEKSTAPLVILPTGNTPLKTYDAIANRYAHRRDIWEKFRYLQLDEYKGLAADDPILFKNQLARAFLDRMGVPQANRMTFQSDAADPAAECARIEDWIARNGPPDIAVLGLGGDGHIGFNMPGSPFDSGTRLAELTPETIAANQAYMNTPVPKINYTLGIGTLAQARHTFLLVSARKAILSNVLNGPVTPDIPATALRAFPNPVTIIAEKAALGL
jgi:glucosamine-6-phosphate deaminase